MPTFGGGDSYSAASMSDRMRGTRDSPASNGHATNITVKLGSWDNGESIMCLLYDNSDNSLVGQTEERSEGHASTQWAVFEFDPPVEISKTVEYNIILWCEGPTLFYYGSSVGDWYLSADETFDSSPPDPKSFSASTGWIVSIYCTYTEGGGSSTPSQKLIGTGEMSTVGQGNMSFVNI